VTAAFRDLDVGRSVRPLPADTEFELERVIPVGRTVNSPEGRVIVCSVEIWSGLVVVRWVLPEPVTRDRGAPYFKLGDDRGTLYLVYEAGFGGTLFTGWSTFMPQPSEEATVLYVGAALSKPAAIEVDLTV
jgi:hypothetical protein